MPWPRLRACRDVIFTFSTIIFSAMLDSRAELFRGMRGMGRVFQGAATVDSILRDDLIEDAAAAGLRSLFVGFETLSHDSLKGAGKRQNLGRDYREVARRLDGLGIMINGSFVFGLDGDDRDVFPRTVDWAVRSGITTATFHVLTPYPGTALVTPTWRHRIASKRATGISMTHDTWSIARRV